MKNYVSWQIEDKLCGKMQDDEMNDLVEDLRLLAKYMDYDKKEIWDLESYRKGVAEFKKKWFQSDYDSRLKPYIVKELQKLHDNLKSFLGGDNDV